jgi:hypothetical protein
MAILYVAPLINGNGYDWKTLNCLKLSDDIELYEEEISSITDDNLKKEEEKKLKINKKERDLCNNKVAMYGLEYSAFIIDVIVGFICSLLGFIHYLDEGKSFIPKTGLIGLVSGGIGFVMTVIYFLFNLLVYTSPSEIRKVDENMAYAKWDSSKKVYVCNFYDEDDTNSINAKYSELGKKQYNYIKELYLSNKYDENSEIRNCIRGNMIDCSKKNNITGPFSYISKGSLKDCTQLYKEPEVSNKNLDLNNRWLTTIILSIIIILCNACLAIFGFLLFKNKEESGEVQVV